MPGILTVEIGIAPVKPAEFVVFRISQFYGGAGARGVTPTEVPTTNGGEVAGVEPTRSPDHQVMSR